MIVASVRRDSRIDVGRLVQWIGEREGVTFSPSGVLSLRVAPPATVLDTAGRTLDEIVGKS